MRPLCFLLLALLVGCATSAPGPASPLTVTTEQQARYWVSKEGSFRPDVSPPAQGKQYATEVEVEYTIDSKGRVHDARVASFVPADADPRWALNAISVMRFEPGPDNADRRAIRTRTAVQLEP